VLAPTPGIVVEMKCIRGDEQVSLWSRGVDRALFSPDRRDSAWRRTQGWRDDDVVVLFFGRLVLEKGVREFISIVKRLEARGVPVKPLVVGAGPAEQLFAALPNALLTGHLDGPELARAVASADVLIHPSRTEAFGNVVLEAMASGLAIVCAASDSAESLLNDGRSGILSEGNSDALALEVQRLATDPQKRRTLGNHARSASRAFSWDAASASALKAYERTAASRN
jgi:glycosyltransferase involved in cell wall biosynthesis